MSKQLFKGIKSVLGTTFAEVAAADRKGYIWFVRTVVDSDTDTEGVQDDNNLTNDIYDIYFGTKHYARYQEGQIESLTDKIAALDEESADVAAALLKVAGIVNVSLDGDGKITVMDEDFANLAAAFAKVTARFGEVEGDIKDLQDSLTEIMVKNVAEGDKILTVADGILSSTIGLKYENNKISLTGIGGEEIAGFDATDFLKDSVLEDVKVETKEDGEKYIIFTWKTEGESTKTDEIKVSDFAKLYNAGTALELAEDGVTFNVKVAEANNFLSVNASNELVVDDMTVDKAFIKEDITIEGGPLADIAKQAYTGGTITAGTSIQEFLKNLLCVEIYPVPTKNTPSYSVSISAPSVTATGGNNNGLVEVGQAITFSEVTAKAVSITKTEPTVSGFEHGYSATVDGDDVVDATSISASWTVSQMENNVYELSAKSTGFTGTLPTTVQNAAAASCKLASCTLVAVEGTNKYVVTEDAPKHTGSHDGVASYYIVSNLGGRSEDKKSVAIAAQTGVEQDPSNQSATFTVTGVYPVYTNGVSASTADATGAAMADLAAPVTGDGTKLALMKSNTSFAVSFANQGLEPYRLFLPGAWKVTTAMAINPTTAKYAIDCKTKFVANGTVTRTIQGKEVTYTVYEWASTEGPNRVKFTVA